MYHHETAIKALQAHDKATCATCGFIKAHDGPARTIKLCPCGQQSTLGDYCVQCALNIPL